MSVYHRTTCRLCTSAQVEMVVKLEPIPLAESYCDTPEDARKTPCFPVDLYMCQQCGHVQQLDVVGGESLWGNYTYSSGAAKGMAQHFDDIFRMMKEKNFVPEKSLVVDIGSNDGSLLRVFQQAGHRVLGVDPAREIADKASASGIPTFAEPMTLPLAQRIRKENGKAHIVCIFNAFAHMDNLQEILHCVRYLLHQDGIFVFEAQYLGDIIDKTLIATIFHEHMSHHSLTALQAFFEREQLEMVDVQHVPVQHGAIVGMVQHCGGPHSVQTSVHNSLQAEKERGLTDRETLLGFGLSVATMREKVSQWARGCKAEGNAIAGFGAARSGPTLIAQLGLHGVIDYIFDDHPQKVGRYSAGEGTIIVPTSEIYTRMPPYTIILAWVHAAKIIADHQDYLQQGGTFIVLCPTPHIVDKDGEHLL